MRSIDNAIGNGRNGKANKRKGEAGVLEGVLGERYVENKLDYKSGEETLKAKLKQGGQDMQRLLWWLESTENKELKEGKQVKLLEQIFREQYEVEKAGELMPVKIHEPGVIHSPHEEEAQWSSKGHGKAKKDWVGYKVQVAESIATTEAMKAGEPTRNFITSIVTQEAIESDEVGLSATIEAQEEMGLEKPSELYVDGAYVSAAILAEAQREGREVVGPAQASPSKRPEGFRSEDFDVRTQELRAVCPAGKQNTQCSRLNEEKSGKISYRFEWSTHCHECVLRKQCVSGDQKHRTLVVGEHHSALQQRRKEQKSKAFSQRMKVRNGIEGTQSELVRGHGLRRARYRGKSKVNLQNQCIAAACNVKRWLRRLAWEIKMQILSRSGQIFAPAFS